MSRENGSDEDGMKARIWVFPRQDILDPQGKAIRQALGRLGFDGVSEVRAGKSFEVVFNAASAEEAEAAVRKMCESFLVNPVVEDYAFEWVGEDA